MTDPNQSETGQEQASQGLPIPKLEQPSAGGTPSSVDTAAIVKQVTESLRQELRMAQSTKDKEIAKIKKQLNIRELDELEEMGVSIPDNVKLEYRFRQLEQEHQQPTQPTQALPGNSAALTAQDVSEVIKNAKLDANDAEVLEALRGTYRDRNHFEATLYKMALTRATQSPPSPAASTTLNAPPAQISATDIQGKVNKLNEYLKQPSKHKDEIKKLKEELQAANWGG